MGKKTGAKTYKRRSNIKRGARKMTLVNTSLTPMPQRFITRMKYSDTFSVAALGSNRYMFNLNNIYDPNRTGSGHQPYGYDQLEVFYNRYRVIRCSYTIEMYPSEGTSPIRFCALPANEEVTNATLSDACEDPRSKWAVQVPGGAAKKLHGSIYLPSLLGRTLEEYRGSQGPLWNAAPGDNAVLNIYAQGLNDTNVNAVGVITMEYVIEAFDPKITSQS